MIFFLWFVCQEQQQVLNGLAKKFGLKTIYFNDFPVKKKSLTTILIVIEVMIMGAIRHEEPPLFERTRSKWKRS